MFQTNAEWEEARYTAFLRELLQQPGLRRYPIVELSKDSSVIFVDIFFKNSDKETGKWNRYICSSLTTATELLAKFRFAEVRLYFQTFDAEHEEYTIDRLVEILMVVDKQDDYFLLCRRRDGKLYEEGSNQPYEINGLRTCTLWAESKN